MKWLKSRKSQQDGDRNESEVSKPSQTHLRTLMSRIRPSRDSSSVRGAAARDQAPPTEVKLLKAHTKVQGGVRGAAAGEQALPTEVRVPEVHSKAQGEEQTRRDLWSAAFEQLDSSKKKTLEDPSTSVRRSSSSVSVVEHVIQQTEKAYEDYKNKGWRVQRGKGKGEINVRDEAKKILSATLDVKSLIDSTVRSDPTGYASTAWTIVSLGLQLAQNDQDRLDMLFKSSAFLANLLARYAIIEVQYLDQNIKDVDRLEDAIIDVYVAVLEYAGEVRSTKEQNAIKRSVAAVQALAGQPLQLLQEAVLAKDKDAEAWRSLVSHVYRRKEFEESSNKADIMLDKIDRMTADVSTIKEVILTQEEEHLLRCISSINVSDSYNRSVKRREAGTGNWLLGSAAYKNWRANARTFLWLHGTSGCGKTILCSTIIEDLTEFCSDSRHVLAYWYFDFNDTQKQVVDHMLSSLIRQLAAAAKEIPQEVLALAKELRSSGRQPGTRILLSTLNSVIKSIDKEVFVVIDALDECPEKADHAKRQDLLNQMTELLSKHNTNLHLLATSRKEADIRESLQALATANLDIQTAFRGDIELFVEQRLKEVPRLTRWSHAIKAEIESELLRVDQPRFRWAALQLEALEDCSDEAEIRETLRNIPQTLEQTYERTLTQLPTRDQAREVAAVGGLTFPEDVLIICTSTLVSSSVGDIKLDRYNERRCEIVRLAHFSVREYLCSVQTSNMAADTSFRMSAKLAHFEIGMRCVKELLKLDEVPEYSPSTSEPDDLPDDQSEPASEAGNSRTSLIQSMDGGSDRSVVGNFVQRVREHSPLLEYSILQWVKHAKLIQPADTETRAMVISINEFFSQEASLCYETYLRCCDPESDEFDVKGRRKRIPPINFASSHGLITNVFEFIQRQENVNSECANPMYGTPLLAASIAGHVNIVHLLLESGADVNFKIKSSIPMYETALVAASVAGHVSIVQLLLKSGADVDLGKQNPDVIPSVYGTALAAASAKGHLKIVQLLLESGADINFHAVNNYTPLQAACRSRQDKVVSYLLEAGAEVDYVSDTRFSETPLRTACRGNRIENQNIVADLLAAGADVNREEKPPPLQLACNFGNYEIAAQLLSAGADPNATEEFSQPSLVSAVLDGNYEFTDQLLNSGADPDIQDQDHKTPLWHARHSGRRGKHRMIQTLLAAGATDVDVSDNEDLSSLSSDTSLESIRSLASSRRRRRISKIRF